MQRTNEVSTRSGAILLFFLGTLSSSGSSGGMVPVSSEVDYCTIVLLGASEVWAAVTEVALQQAGAFSDAGLTFRFQP